MITTQHSHYKLFSKGKMIGRSIASTAVRVGQRRSQSTAAPKMHKWAESGEALAKTRPPPGHEHVR